MTSIITTSIFSSLLSPLEILTQNGLFELLRLMYFCIPFSSVKIGQEEMKESLEGERLLYPMQPSLLFIIIIPTNRQTVCQHELCV